MSGYKKIAFAGAGNIGKLVVGEFINQNQELKGALELVVLTRNSEDPKLAEIKNKGVKPITVDYNKPETLEQALVGVDCVISTLGGAALPQQVPLAQAAKKADVKLFVPSEFGVPTTGLTSGPLKYKADLQEEFKKVGIPLLLVFTGCFPDFCLQPYIGFDFKNGKSKIVAVNSAPTSWTYMRDIGRYLAYIITSVPSAQLQNNTLRIEGDKKSTQEILQYAEKIHGKKQEVEPIQRVEEKDATVETFVPYLLTKVHDGKAVVGEPLANKLFPNWNPRSVESVIQELAKA